MMPHMNYFFDFPFCVVQVDRERARRIMKAQLCNSGALKCVRSGLDLHSVFVMIVGKPYLALQPRARGWCGGGLSGWTGGGRRVWFGSGLTSHVKRGKLRAVPKMLLQRFVLSRSRVAVSNGEVLIGFFGCFCGQVARWWLRLRELQRRGKGG